MKFSIVIPTYTRSDKLRECLASVVKYTDLSETEVLVVANGASNETRDICKVYREFPVTLLWFPEPIGYPMACNAGIKAATGEYIVLLNDDAELLSQPQNEWIDKLVAPMLRDELIGITGPLKEHDPNSGSDFIIFFCVMIQRAVFDSIGLLDEIFSPYFGEDTDFCLRAEKVGWKSVRVPENVPTRLADIDPSTTTLEAWKHDKMHTGDFPIWHDAESTIGRLPESEDILRRNRLILKERYGKVEVNIERAKVTDGWIAEDELLWLAQQAKACGPNARIAQVGVWHGRSSRALSDNLREGAKLFDVDSFNGSSGEPEQHATAKEREGDHCFQWYWDNQYELIINGTVIPMRMLSANAAHSLAHRGITFDMIFIDADHTYEGLKSDIEAWLPLLKEGGLLCGHDYYREGEDPFAWMGVRQCVEETFGEQLQKSATSIWHVRPHAHPAIVEPERGHVYDAFIFCAELDLLEMRLSTLGDVVDRFVLVEGTQYHNGDPKPLFFDENKERFAKWLPKITHIVVDDWPQMLGNVYDCAWARERHQRDSILHGLKDCKDNDIIILGDADEIPNPEAVANYKVTDGLVRLKQRMFYYFLNCENKEGWDWQKIAPYSLVKERTPCGIRYPDAGTTPLLENGGWHFSMLGGAEAVKLKLATYSHQEMNRPEILDGVESAIANGTDLFGRDLKYEFVNDGNFPAYVRDNWAALVEKGYWHFPQADVVVEPSTFDPAKRSWSVTASISTKDRYQTTLPLAISAIVNQTRLPDKLKIYDDGEQKNLFELAPFNGLLRLAQDKGIDIEVLSTPRMGQVSNHQHCLDNATTDLIWRVDDDEIPEPNCLDTLLNTIRDYERGGSAEKVGAVGGLVHHPGNVSPLPSGVDGSLNDVASGLNLAWFQWNGGVRKAEHLYSTFLFNVDAARKAGGYPRNLSPAGHREETIMSHGLHRAGYDLLVTPWAKTHHLREATGGIRSFSNQALWEHDEQVFQGYLKAWGVVQPDTKLIVADYGLGDHLVLKGIWPELKRKFPDRKWTLSLCYPEVFKGEDVTIISIADAKLLVGSKYGEFSVYRYAWENNLERPMPEIMMEFYSK